MNAPRMTLRARLFLAFTLISLLAVTLQAIHFRNRLEQERLDIAGRQIQAQAFVFKNLFEAEGAGEQERLAALLAAAKNAGLRMTVTDRSGTVLHDSHFTNAPLQDMDNHNDRPEIEAAALSGHGISIRHSNTLGLGTLYAAAKLDNGGVLRLAEPLPAVHNFRKTGMPTLVLMLAGIGCLCFVLSVIITRRFRDGIDTMAEVVGDISRKKGGRRLLQVPGREFLPLAHAVNRLAENIENYVTATTDQQTQLEVILDSMHEGVLVLGPSGNIRRYNRALQALFPSVSQAAGKQLIEGIPVPALQRKVDELLQNESGENHTDEAIHLEMESGRFLIAHLSHPVTRNRSLGAVIVVYDATEIMRLEGVRKDFVANVSHELRTPLTAITGYAETLMHLDELSPEHRRFAAVIHKHAQTLDRVIDDLLSLARIENTREKISLAPSNPADPLNEALRLCNDQMEQKQLRLSVELDRSRHIMGNASLLVQVFRNLLENACRYSPQEGEILVSGTVQEREMLFSINDQGPGIPGEELSRIFERLYQIKKQRNSGFSGIGLAISKHIIERHGGRIWAESPCGDFATAMRFTLPLA